MVIMIVMMVMMVMMIILMDGDGQRTHFLPEIQEQESWLALTPDQISIQIQIPNTRYRFIWVYPLGRIIIRVLMQHNEDRISEFYLDLVLVLASLTIQENIFTIIESI